tara:strand:+ start:2065 stop:3366 length:1302 start_codon:yes stop_codon:yes gene_type:complete
MIEYINSLDRKRLIILGKKVKAPGYITEFTTPEITNEELRNLVIENITDNKVIKKIKSKKSTSQKKKLCHKRSAKKGRTIPEVDFKITSNKSYYPLPEGAKLIAIGDLHGDYMATIKSLKLAGVIPMSTSYCDDPESISWVGYDTYIVQVGDQLDRCRPTEWYRDVCADNETYKDEGSDLKIMRLLDNLHLEAQKMGGAVISILGNHEIMNCVGDFRYVSPLEFEEFGEYFNAKKTQHKRIFPYGYRERKNAFSPGGIIAKRFASLRHAIVQVGKWVFVHGGITPHLAEKYSLDEMNNGIKKWLLGGRDKKTKTIFNDLYEDDENGIFWTREFGDLGNWTHNSDKLFHKTVDLLNQKNDRNMKNFIEGVVMGHTPQYMNMKGINSSCNGKCWRVDVGASRAFGPFTKTDDENKYRKCSILMIKDGKCRILKEK